MKEQFSMPEVNKSGLACEYGITSHRYVSAGCCLKATTYSDRPLSDNSVGNWAEVCGFIITEIILL